MCRMIFCRKLNWKPNLRYLQDNQVQHPSKEISHLHNTWKSKAICIHRIAFGEYYGLRMSTLQLQIFQFPSRSKGIVGRVLKFAGYTHHYKFCLGIFWPHFKNKMATMGISLSVMKQCAEIFLLPSLEQKSSQICSIGSSLQKFAWEYIWPHFEKFNGCHCQLNGCHRCIFLYLPYYW